MHDLPKLLRAFLSNMSKKWVAIGKFNQIANWVDSCKKILIITITLMVMIINIDYIVFVFL